MNHWGIHRFEDLQSPHDALRTLLTRQTPPCRPFSDVASHPLMTEELLREAFRCEHDRYFQHRAAAVEHPDFPVDLFDAALLDRNVRHQASAHPSCPPSLVERHQAALVAEAEARPKITTRVEWPWEIEERWDAAGPAELARIGDLDRRERAMALALWADTEEVRRYLEKDPDDYAISDAAHSASLRPDAARVLFDIYLDRLGNERRDLPWMVVENVVLNPQAPRSLLLKMLRHPKRSLLAFEHCDDLFEAMDPNEEETREVFELGLTTDCPLSWAAAQYVPYPDLAAQALESSNSAVRVGVLFRIGVSANPLIRELGSRVMPTASQAERRDLLMGDYVSAAVLQQGLSDGAEDLRALAVLNPLTRRDQIQPMLKDPSPSVRKAAKRALSREPWFTLLERLGCRLCGRPDLHSEWHVCDRFFYPEFSAIER